MTSRCNKIPIL